MKRGRVEAAINAMKHTAEFSDRPYLTLTDLAYYYLALNQPGNALETFDDAVRAAPKDIDAADDGAFHFRVAQGRSNAWAALGNLERATSSEEEAVRFVPNLPQAWQRLAQLYQLQGRSADAERAREQAAKIAQNHGP
jgi:tetratricopeptide (TPR) repeat protein